jgi:ABC-type uncharacterized transport system involved in gliding motility auxiliary subunit
MAANPKRITTFAQAATYTIIFVAILAAVNFLANRYTKSFDATANKRYTLSEQSVKIVKGLQQDMTISYWDLPDRFAAAKDLLDRYTQHSQKLKVLYRDLDKNRTEAIAAKITQRGAITVQIGNKTETARALTEEEVTGAMVRALKGGDRSVCFTSGYGDGAIEDGQAQGYSNAKTLTERANYKTKSVSLIPVPEIPADCTVLVVGGPKRDYLPAVVEAIKKYVEGGGHALINLDPPLKVGAQIDDNEAFTKLIEGWGVKLHKDLVLDARGEQVGLGAEFPVAGDYGDHPIVRDMKAQRLATVFPIARSMESVGGTPNDVEMLVKTGPSAFSKEDLKSAAPPENRTPGERILAMAGTLAEGAKGRFVIVGTSSWLDNGGVGLSGNRDLFLNMVSWLSSDEDMISIRPKDPDDRRLNMNQRQMNWMFFGSVIGLPILMLLAGISVWWGRR